MRAARRPTRVHTICEALPLPLLSDLLEMTRQQHDNAFDEAYTEHPGRSGVRMGPDHPVVVFLASEMKETVLRSFDETGLAAQVSLSDVTLCRDAPGFALPLHVDDGYKYISCVLYLNDDDVSGTTFLTGMGSREEVRAETNKLLYFKSRGLYHRVDRTDATRYTLQFHFRKSRDDPCRRVALFGFSSRTTAMERAVLALLRRGREAEGGGAELRWVTSDSSDARLAEDELGLHLGIDVRLKRAAAPDYHRVFFAHDPRFVGLNRNVLYDANDEASTTHGLRDRYVMVSRGSWNAHHKRYFPTVRGAFDRFLEATRPILREWWSPSYRIPPFAPEKNAVSVFVQNYSVTEYWFGWRPDDVTVWLAREMNALDETAAATTKAISVKFHPKMDVAYARAYREEAARRGHDVRYWDRRTPLKTVFDAADACVINSGTTAIAALVYGLPVFCVNDAYSSVPVHRLAVGVGVARIDDLSHEAMPDRRAALDFIFSQIFSLEELQSMSLHDLSAHPS